VRLSVKLRPQQIPWSVLERTWVAADAMPEVDAAWLFDHFYPISGAPEDEPCFEGWSALAFLAARTERVRLGLIVSGVTYRHPAVLANMCATLDHASRGRLEIGMGAAWNEAEHVAYGLSFPPIGVRMDMLDEALAVMHALFTEETATFAGRHYTLSKARCEPKPVQTPRPPFVIGGQGERRTLPIAARWADQWNYPGGADGGLPAKLEVLQRCCAGIGRDPHEIEVSTHLLDPIDPRSAARDARTLADQGCDHVMLYLQRQFDPGILRDVVHAVADAVK
jgi:F420-dependent oxidoreductase-like protein